MTDMTYHAHPIPTLGQLLGGELEPSSRTFKGAVSAYRTAIWQGIGFAIFTQWLAVLGLTTTAPSTLIGMTAQAAFIAFVQATWSRLYIQRHRRPSVEQISRLARMVRADPSLASKVALMGERDFTFHRLQQFIMKNSDKANLAWLQQATDDLDDAVHGK